MDLRLFKIIFYRLPKHKKSIQKAYKRNVIKVKKSKWTADLKTGT